MRRSIIAVFSLIVLFILFIVLCTYVRRPYERVLLNRFGSLVLEKDQTRIAYNWYLKLPTDGVVRIDTRLHLFPGSLQQLVTADHQSISVQTYAAWRIVDPVKFFNTTSGGSDVRAQQILDNKISGLVHNAVSTHPLEDLFNTDPTKLKTPEMEKNIAIEASNGSKGPAAPGAASSSGMLDQGIEIVQVGFSRMSFPPANAEAVYERMAQDQNTIANRYRAEGEAEAKKIEEDGIAAAAKTRADAVVEAEKTRGKADQEVLAALAAVQTSQAARDFYQYYKSLDFAKNSLSKNAYFVLSSDVGFLKALFQPPANGQNMPQTMPAASAGPGGPSAPPPSATRLPATSPMVFPLPGQH